MTGAECWGIVPEPFRRRTEASWVADHLSSPRELLLGDSIPMFYTVTLWRLIPSISVVNGVPDNCTPARQSVRVQCYIGDEGLCAIHNSWSIHDIA